MTLIVTQFRFLTAKETNKNDQLSDRKLKSIFCWFCKDS